MQQCIISYLIYDIYYVLNITLSTPFDFAARRCSLFIAGAAGAGRAAGGDAGAGRAAGGAPMPFKYASIQRQKNPLRDTPSDAEYSSALAFTAGGKRKR